MIPQNLVNMSLSVDGRGYAGVVTSLTLPKLSVKTEEHRAGGMDVPIDFDMGMEKLEASFSLSGWDPDVLKTYGLVAGNSVAVVFRGAFRNDNAQVVAAVATMRGMLKEVDPGDWKPGDKAEEKNLIALRYYKMEVDGQLIHEIDVLGMKRIIGGTDQLSAVAAALGV